MLSGTSISKQRTAKPQSRQNSRFNLRHACPQKSPLSSPKEFLKSSKTSDYIIHAGDLVELAVVDELEQIAPVLAVHGNMDGIEVTSALPRLNSLKVFDWKIGVMHDPDIALWLQQDA